LPEQARDAGLASVHADGAHNSEPQTAVIPSPPGVVALLGVLMSLVSALALAGETRERIIIVGSSTVYPFSAAVAEHFAR